MRRRDLKTHDALLVGQLDPRTSSGELLIKVWCPYCKRHHFHGWPSEKVRSDHVENRLAHCTMASRILSSYWIGIERAK